MRRWHLGLTEQPAQLSGYAAAIELPDMSSGDNFFFGSRDVVGEKDVNPSWRSFKCSKPAVKGTTVVIAAIAVIGTQCRTAHRESL